MHLTSQLIYFQITWPSWVAKRYHVSAETQAARNLYILSMLTINKRWEWTDFAWVSYQNTQVTRNAIFHCYPLDIFAPQDGGCFCILPLTLNYWQWEWRKCITSIHNDKCITSIHNDTYWFEVLIHGHWEVDNFQRLCNSNWSCTKSLSVHWTTSASFGHNLCCYILPCSTYC